MPRHDDDGGQSPAADDDDDAEPGLHVELWRWDDDDDAVGLEPTRFDDSVDDDYVDEHPGCDDSRGDHHDGTVYTAVKAGHEACEAEADLHSACEAEARPDADAARVHAVAPPRHLR